ncbi:hypothetical protein Q9L58_001507 [Maublancomyces gigas]|uniref:Ankyrin repeat protein n=1 Tax=Discina gigas TaxID=1032678 RepID=A0ABR3GU60_9PEZI
MSLLALPNELLLKIARCLLRCPGCHGLHHEHHISALSHCNHRLYALLADCHLETASALKILLWAIAHTRHDTFARALEKGADPNTPLHHIYISNSRPVGTPVDVAIRMRVHSFDAESHARKLGTIALFLRAGGTCTADSLAMPTLYGDVDLLTLCLPHLTDTDPNHSGPRTILEIAARRGHVEIVRLAISAGAAVNSTGSNHSAEFCPPLWVCWGSSIAVLQAILDAGADATWRSPDGVSVVQHMRQRSGNALELEDKIALLMKYGAIDEPASEHTLEWQRRMPPGREYRGWTAGSWEDSSSAAPVERVQWVPARRE